MSMIRNVWAVGRNYAEHAKELGNKAPQASDHPMIFLKAGSSIVESGHEFQLPSFSNEVNFEVELAFQFGLDYQLKAVAVAIDLTARDIQNQLKSASHPWTLAKSFRDSCLLGPLVSLHGGIDPEKLEFELRVNGQIRQKGHAQQMIHKTEKLRSYVVERFPVSENDLLLTGTPAGVAKIDPGDLLEAEILGLSRASWKARSTPGN